MEPMARIELATSPLPRECSATELHGQATILPKHNILYIAITLPLPILQVQLFSNCELERVKGIEPSS
jgi:hypothetical protein